MSREPATSSSAPCSPSVHEQLSAIAWHLLRGSRAILRTTLRSRALSVRAQYTRAEAARAGKKAEHAAPAAMPAKK